MFLVFNKRRLSVNLKAGNLQIFFFWKSPGKVQLMGNFSGRTNSPRIINRQHDPRRNSCEVC